MQAFNPNILKVTSYFTRFHKFKRDSMHLILWYIQKPSIQNPEADHIRESYKTNYSKIQKICKDYDIAGLDNLVLIYLIIKVHNNKEERNQNRIEATEYWMQLKSLIDSLEGYEIPGITDPNITDKNRFSEIRFCPKRDPDITISNPKLIFNLVSRMLPFLREHYDKSEYEEVLSEITPYVGLKNAPDGFRITRNKLIFSVNNYLEAEEPHLKFQTTRSRVIKELFDLTDYPITISLRSIEKRIKRDKQASK